MHITKLDKNTKTLFLFANAGDIFCFSVKRLKNVSKLSLNLYWNGLTIYMTELIPSVIHFS